MSSPQADRSVSRGRSRTPIRDDDAQSRSRSRSNARSNNGNTSPSPAPAIPRSAKIVIEKLTKNVKEAHLREIFSNYGEIEELEMPMNKHFMTNRGIAYVLYTDAKFAEDAISNMHEAQLDGALVNVSIVLPRRRFSRSPPPIRPPPNRFGEPHRHREGPPMGNRDFGGGRGPPPRGGSPGYRGGSPPYRGGGGRRGSPGPRGGRGGGGGGGFRDRYDDRENFRPRSYSRSRSPPLRRGVGSPRRSPRYDSRSRSPSRTPPPARRGGRSPVGRGGGGGGRRRSYSSYSSRSRSPSRERGGRGGGGGRGGRR